MKKKYESPKMTVIECLPESNLLCSSSTDPYWNGCHEGWKGSWGDDED